MKIHRVSSLSEYRTFLAKTTDAYAEHMSFLKSILPEAERDFTYRGYSYAVGKEVDFINNFKWSTGYPAVNWRECVFCPITWLNNRMRAAIHICDLFSNAYSGDRVYIMEQLTPTYKYLAECYPALVGSEYLGDGRALGTYDERGIRNEDATQLTFEDESFVALMSFDVFEHIYDFRTAFKECYRVLRAGGCMIFTVPFNHNVDENIERAIILDNGEISHLLPPEYHGSPLSSEGVLCFRHYGWSMLNELRNIGFSEATALIFNSKEMGYLTNQTVFYCKK